MKRKGIHWGRVGSLVSVGAAVGFSSLSIFLTGQLQTMQALQEISSITNKNIIFQVQLMARMQKAQAATVKH